MKKNILSLLVLLSLYSCNQDSIESITETSNEEGASNSAFTYDNNLPNGYIYESPYDLTNPQSIALTMFNSVPDIDIVLTPFFINGYWDGADDGLLNYGPGTIIPNGTSISSLPLLFYNGSEYGNYFKADEIYLSAGSNYDYTDISQNGFAIDNGPNDFFEFNNWGLSQIEKDLIRNYGKLIGFHYVAYDSSTGNRFQDGFIFSNFYTNASNNGSFTSPLQDWTPMAQTIQLFGLSEQIYHNTSQEIMMAQDGGYNDDFTITNPNSGNTYSFQFTSNSFAIKLALH